MFATGVERYGRTFLVWVKVLDPGFSCLGVRPEILSWRREITYNLLLEGRGVCRRTPAATIV
jgi:hypothetical protein